MAERIFSSMQRDVVASHASSLSANLDALRAEASLRIQDGMFQPFYGEMPAVRPAVPAAPLQYYPYSSCIAGQIPLVLDPKRSELQPTVMAIMPTRIDTHLQAAGLMIDLVQNEYPFFVAYDTHGAQITIVTNMMRVFLSFNTEQPVPATPAQPAVPIALASAAPNRVTFWLSDRPLSQLPIDYIHFALRLLEDARVFGRGPILLTDTLAPVPDTPKNTWLGVRAGNSRLSIVAAYERFIAVVTEISSQFWMRDLVGPAALSIKAENTRLRADVAECRRMRSQFELDRDEFLATSGQRLFAKRLSLFEEEKARFAHEKHVFEDQAGVNEIRRLRIALRLALEKNRLLSEELVVIRKQLDELTCDGAAIMRALEGDLRSP